MPLFLGGGGQGARSDSGHPHPTKAPAWLWDTRAVPLLGLPLLGDRRQRGRRARARQLLLPVCGGGSFPPHRGCTAPGSEQHLEHGHLLPGLSGPARPRLTHRQGGATVLGPPLAGAAVPSCSRDPFPEPKRPKAEAGGCLLPCPGVSTQGIPTTSRDTLRKARSRGDGSAPGASGIGILAGMLRLPGLPQIPGRSRSGQSPAVTSNRPKGPAPRGPEWREPARFAPDCAKMRLGVALDAKGHVWHGTSFAHRHRQLWDTSGSTSGHAHPEPLCF